MDDSTHVLYCKDGKRHGYLKPKVTDDECMKLNNTIYADYQATTPVDPRVLEKMLPFWTESFGNPHSNDHIVGWKAAEAVRESQTSVAAMIGADPDEIVFTSGATEANNLALFGLARRAAPSRRRILVSAIEHKCVLAAAGALEEREGFIVETIPVDSEGYIDLDVLESMLDDSVLVASIMAVNNEVGTIQDVSAIAGLLACHGVVFHCDAAQAPCAMDVSRFAEFADLISLSGPQALRPTGHRGVVRPKGPAVRYRTSHIRRWAAERPAVRHRAGTIVCGHSRRC